jgi:hypothetical protein
MNAIVIDIEANDLYPFQTQTWTICLKRIGGESLTLNPFKSTREKIKQQLLDFIFKQDIPTIIGHNLLGYDGWVLWKDFGLNFHVGKDSICGKPVTFYDTLFASQFVYPDREGGHSLKSWGERLGFFKIDYRSVALELGIIQPHESEFCRWSKQMDEYCLQDTEVTEKVFNQLYPITEESVNAFKLGQKNFFLMQAQAYTGFKLDKEKALDLQKRIEQMITDLKNEVEPDLPKRPLKKSEESYYTIPAKPYTKDGKFSAIMNNFIERHKAKVNYEGAIEVNGKSIRIIPGAKVIDSLPMSLSDQNELKDYFLSLGWEPSLWNFQKDERGKPKRDDRGQMIKTSPKIQDAGKICPNLLNLDGDLPKKIVRFLSLRNRLSVLTGWLEHPRLKWDGRLTAGATGIAATHRQKHHTVVNVPKAQEDVLLGKEFRSLFTVDSGNKLIGVDQAALEARCEAHWVYEFDPGSAHELIAGDIHSINAKAFFPRETDGYNIHSHDFNKDDPGFKPFRSKSKNGKYAVTYGCSAPKLAKTLGKPEKEGTVLFDNFWAANPGLKRLKDKVEHEWETVGGKKWIYGIDGRKLYSRSKHSLVNLLFQSTGAIIVDYAVCLFDMKMGYLNLDEKGRPYYKYKGKIVKRVQYFHDEFGCETSPEVAEEIAKLMEWCMEEAGRRLKLNVPLIGEAKVGENWKETH